MFGCRKNLEAEIVLFDKIDFNSGEYKLVFYGGEGGIIENYFNFYIDDSKTLNQIKNNGFFQKNQKYILADIVIIWF